MASFQRLVNLDNLAKKVTLKTKAKLAEVVPTLSITAAAAAAVAPKKPSQVQSVLNTYSMTQVATASMEQAIKQCTEKVDAIVKECYENNCKFRDQKFDLQNERVSCLYASLTSEVVFATDGCKRVPDLFKNPVFFLNGASPSDIVQGAAGDCWFLASLAVISNIPGLIEKLCVKRNEAVGVYGFIFFKDGDWISTVVDDQLFYKIDPQSHKRSLFFTSCEEPRETWLPLMEKAFAKIHGDYETLQSGFTAEGLEDITGGVATISFTNDILDKDLFWNREMKRINIDTLMGCSINWVEGTGEKHGIQDSHAYSVLKIAELENGERLVNIRNPWGKVEWNGQYSDDSDDWTPELRELLNHKDKDDGQFWMPYLEFLRIFTNIDRCRVFDSRWSVASTWIPYDVVPKSTGRFEFTTKVSGETVIVMAQPDVRYYGAFERDFVYTLGFHVYDSEQKLIKRAKVTVPYSLRSISTSVNLEAGSYAVVPFITRKATDISGEVDEDDHQDALGPATKINAPLAAEETAIDKKSAMFRQNKARLVRATSLARLHGTTILGVDDEDFQESKLEAAVSAEQWQLMVGLRVYSQDRTLQLDGLYSPPPLGETAKATEEDPESVSGTKPANSDADAVKEAKEAAATVADDEEARGEVEP